MMYFDNAECNHDSMNQLSNGQIECRLCGRFLKETITIPLTHAGLDTNLQEIYKMDRFDGVKQTESFVTKDSGKRQEFSTGMVRDIQTDKPRYDLLDLPMLKRWAELMARGALKYGEENWRKAATEEELKRFKASALRHMYQWIEGDTTEDHGAAVFFNISGAELVKDKLGKLPISGFKDIRQG